MVVDEVLRQGVQGISELITIPGLINVDFNDVKAVMSGAGSALMGIGQASGENKAIEAAKMAINSPLLEMSIEGARGILFTIVGGSNLSMHEVNEAAKIITSSADEDAKIIFGAVIDPKYNRIQIFNFVRLTAESFPDGEEGNAYSETVAVEGSQGEVSFNVSSGALPTGLTLSSSGELTGEPSEAGEFTFTITATDPNESIIGAAYSDSHEYTITITSPADEESPEISNVVATPDSTTARISWTTNENASSTVFFGLTTDYEMDHIGSDDLVTSHTVDISGLSACTTYHFMVASSDESRNNAFSEDATFRTTNCPSGGGGSVVPIVLPSFNQSGGFQVFLPSTSESQTMRELLFKRNLYFGLVDSDVRTLQHFLNTHGFPLAKTGPGSIGHETDYFGQRTRQALILFQKRHTIQPAIGFLGPITRNFIGDGN
jgi:hypothetical protein